MKYALAAAATGVVRLLAGVAVLFLCPEFANSALTFQGHIAGVFIGPDGPRGDYDISFHFEESALDPARTSVPISAITFDSWTLPRQVSPVAVFTQLNYVPPVLALADGSGFPPFTPVLQLDAALSAIPFDQTAMDAPPVGYQAMRVGPGNGSSLSFDMYWVGGATSTFTLAATESTSVVPEPSSLVLWGALFGLFTAVSAWCANRRARISTR